MRKSIATASQSGLLEERLVAAAKAGFDVTALFDGDLKGNRRFLVGGLSA